MGYEISYRQVEIPEVDAFLREYVDLCRKHGMKFEKEAYGYDNGDYITLVGVDESNTDESIIPYLDIDEASDVAAIDRAREQVDRIRDEEEAVEAAISAEKRAAREATAAENHRLLQDRLALVRHQNEQLAADLERLIGLAK